jgi:protein-S-isoprenylcysteine O-methyltransferase Ste14
MTSHSLSLDCSRGGNTTAQSAADGPLLQLRAKLSEIAIRMISGTVLTVFAYSAIKQWFAAPQRVTLLLLVAAACLTTGLALFSRVPMRRDWRPHVFLCSMIGTYGFVAYKLTPGIQLAPELVGASLQVAGILWQIYAKASLRRSFGILPANRGVVSHGAYRFMRHPMYLGYSITDIGFLVTNFGLQNLLVFSVQLALQVSRILFEERLLSGDTQYCEYRDAVRYRLVPKVF